MCFTYHDTVVSSLPKKQFVLTRAVDQDQPNFLNCKKYIADEKSEVYDSEE